MKSEDEIPEAMDTAATETNPRDAIMSIQSYLSVEELRLEELRLEEFMKDNKFTDLYYKTYLMDDFQNDVQMCIFICLYLGNLPQNIVDPDIYHSVNIGIISLEESIKISLRIIDLLEPINTRSHDDCPDKLCEIIFEYNWRNVHMNNHDEFSLSVQIPGSGDENSGDEISVENSGEISGVENSDDEISVENSVENSGDKNRDSSHAILHHPSYKIYTFVNQQIKIYLSILLQFNALFYKGLNVNSNSVDFLLKEMREKERKREKKRGRGRGNIMEENIMEENRDMEAMGDIRDQIENFRILMSEQVKTTLYEYVNKDESLRDICGEVIANSVMIDDGIIPITSSDLIETCIKTAHQNFEFKKIYLLLLLSSEIQDDYFKKKMDNTYGTFFHVYEILQYFFPEIIEHFEELDMLSCKLLTVTSIKNILTDSLSENWFDEDVYNYIIKLIKDKKEYLDNQFRYSVLPSKSNKPVISPSSTTYDPSQDTDWNSDLSLDTHPGMKHVGNLTPPKPIAIEAIAIEAMDGGSCEVVNVNSESDLFAMKAVVENSHDFGGPRSEEVTALYNGLSIKNVNGLDLYTKAYRVLDVIANNVVVANAAIAADDSYERQFITDFGLNKPSNEPSFLNLVIETMVKKCPDQVADFYYQPIYEYAFKGKAANPIVYNIFKQKIKEFYPKNEWRVFLKQKKNYDDLYVWVIKKTLKPPLNTSLRLHSQDTGLSNYVLGACLCEVGFNAAFDALFVEPGNVIDIDKFFPSSGNPNDPARLFETQIITELDKITSGTITHDAAGIDIVGSIQITGLTKLIDPANSSKPIYGEIIKKNGAKIEQIYIGYPNTLPMGGGAEHSKRKFDDKIDEEYPSAVNAANAAINTFLKEFNDNAVISTLEAFNLFLSYWIEPDPASNQIVTEYNLILNNNQIIGIHLSNPADGFTFDLHIEDITVSNICRTMIYWFLNQGLNNERVIQQMNNVFGHPRCKYKTMAGVKPSEEDYKLAIIASFKSSGDECQRIEAEHENRYLNSYVGLNKINNYLLMLSDDRVFVAAGIQHNQPIVSNIKSPHPKFYDIDSMPSNKIPDIGGIITGLLCNKLPAISISKTTLELLKETKSAITIEYNLMTIKLGPGGDNPIITGQIQVLTELIDSIELAHAADYNTTRSPDDQNSDKIVLADNNKTIGEMKSILVCLEYFHYTYEDESKSKQKDIYIKYITEQLSSVIASSIDSNTYKNIIAFNTGSNAQQQNINNVDELTAAIKSMFNKIDFAPKLFNCHKLACNQAIKKIEMYNAILNTSTILQREEIAIQREEIAKQYNIFIERIKELRDGYPNKILVSLEGYIGQKQASRERNKPTIFGADMRSPEEKDQEELTRIQQALDAAEAEKLTALLAEGVAAGQAATPPKGKKGFFDKALKTAKSFFKDATSIYDNLIRDKNKLLEKIQISALKAAASVHSTDKTDAITFQTFLRGILHMGGKPKKSRQNKQQYQKKYTKRYKKKIYRKRTQKHLKIKRRKHTKRRK